jgi:hypothetical protein
MADKIVREKTVRHKGLQVQTEADGSVTIGNLSNGAEMPLTEDQALTVYHLLGDMVEWISDKNE